MKTTATDRMNQQPKACNRPFFHPCLGSRYPAITAITILIAIPMMAPLDSTREWEIRSLPLKSKPVVKRAAK